MKTFALFTLAAALGVGTTSMLRTGHDSFPSPGGSAAQTADGAFRDGVYLGKRAAERGEAPHLAIGRWTALEDRSSFTAGYQRGYDEFLASRVASTTRERRPE